MRMADLYLVSRVTTRGATDTELINIAGTCIRNLSLPVTNVWQVFLVKTDAELFFYRFRHFLEAVSRMVP
jgi:hypothetical protein